MKKGIMMAHTLAFLGAGMSTSHLALGRENNRYIGADELERQANGLSNYGGGLAGYTGAGDEFLEFGGENGSFMDSIDEGKVYNITFNNAANATRTALICPGLLSTAAGLMQDGAFNDTSGNAGLTATGSPGSIAAFNAWMQRFPTFVAGFKITSTSLAQLEQTLQVQKETPFFTDRSVIINPSIYMSEANPNSQLITVAKQFQLDNETKVAYNVLAGVTVNFGMIFGASAKLSKALRAKVVAAQATKASYMGR